MVYTLSFVNLKTQYSDCIFCTDQLIDLMERLGANNPESSSKNFKRYHKTEFYSKNDLEVY